MPWEHFGDWYGITPWRLVILGILVMLVRRLPWVVLFVSGPLRVRTLLHAQSRFIPTLPTWREAAFAGFFGPIGELRALRAPSADAEASERSSTLRSP